MSKVQEGVIKKYTIALYYSQEDEQGSDDEEEVALRKLHHQMFLRFRSETHYNALEGTQILLTAIINWLTTHEPDAEYYNEVLSIDDVFDEATKVDLDVTDL